MPREPRGRTASPSLRLYEYERLRGVVFQLDAWLPEDGHFLKVHVRVHNPGAEAVPMWWWSNAAVAETPDVRIVAPAETAWYYKYDGDGLQQTGLPVHEGFDVSYPGRAPDAAEYFFRTAGSALPWVAAVDAEGAGLAQVSTRALPGRKVFRWGTGPGGRRWQDWLGDAALPYLEIQVASPRPRWSTSASLRERRGPGSRPTGRCRSTRSGRTVTGRTPGSASREDPGGDGSAGPRVGPRPAADAVRRAPRHTLVDGSGWGALEQLRRESGGEGPLFDEGAPFDTATLTEDQRPWVDLLCPSAASTALASRDEPPVHLVQGGDWAERLGRLGDGWLPTYLQGLLAHAEQDRSRARLLLETSVADRRTPWALRALAVLELEEGRATRSADLYEEAQQQWPHSPHLTIETVETLLLAGRSARALSVLRGFPDPRCRLGRVRLLQAQALAETGDTALARELLDDGIEVNDLREGEDGLHGLWSSVHPDIPVPGRYDFRMRTDGVELERD